MMETEQSLSDEAPVEVKASGRRGAGGGSNPAIIFFHKGYDPYIAFALWQARRTNPRSPVYLLGDRTNDLAFLGIRHVRFDRYLGRNRDFLGLYQHFSPHELDCERLCIERYFHMADFVEREGIGPFIYLDSDVLLLMDLASFLPAWQTYDVAGAPGLFGMCYYTRPGLVGEFCDFILERYNDAAQIDAWGAGWHAPGPGEQRVAVNDMLLAQMFLKRTGLRYQDLREPRDGVAFNPNFLLSEQECLRVLRHPARPGVYAEMKGQLVQTPCLHFVGWSKRFESAFVDWSWPLVRSFLKPNYRRNLKKLLQHYYFGRKFRTGIPVASRRGSFLNRNASADVSVDCGLW
jgi:hypothetical protein